MSQPAVQNKARQQNLYQQQRIQNLRNQGWGDYETETKSNSARSVTNEFDGSSLYLTPEATTPNGIDGDKNPFLMAVPQIEYAPSIKEVQKIAEIEEKESNHEEARILDIIENKPELNMNGSVNFSPPSELDQPLTQVETDLGQEPALPTEHQTEIKLDLRTGTQHHHDVDFKYFFDTTGGWMKEGAQAASKFALKHTLKVGNFKDAKAALWDTLLLKEIIGLGQKKELSPAEKEQKLKRTANLKLSIDGIRSSLRGILSTEQKRALRQRIESINKSLKRGNLSYEGVVNEQTGQIRDNVLMDSEKANSQKTEDQLKEEKKKKLMMAGKGKPKKGPGITLTMDKAHNFNNAAKLAG